MRSAQDLEKAKKHLQEVATVSSALGLPDIIAVTALSNVSLLEWVLEQPASSRDFGEVFNDFEAIDKKYEKGDN